MIDEIVINEQDLTEEDYRNMFINCSPTSINVKSIDTETIKTEPVAFDDFSWSENEKQAYS